MSTNNPVDAPLADRLLRPWNAFWFVPRDSIVLAAMRIAVGVVAFYWAASYTSDLMRFFGRDGYFPLENLHLLRGSTFPRSLFEFVSTPGGIWALHAACLAVLALFTAGVFTRVTSVLALVAVLSYVHRAPAVTSQAEPVLAMLLAYLCIGPCGAKLSVDSFLKRRRAATKPNANGGAVDPPSWTATVSTRLIQVHLTFAYAAMALAKLNDAQAITDGAYHAWWMGEAAWWLAARPYSPLVDVTGLLSNNVLIVNAWTHAIVLFEASFAIFIWRPALRRLLLWIAVPMWLSLALITGLVPFSLLMLIGNLAFVSPEEMQRLVDRRR